MSKITVWKKVLKCISVEDWDWEYAIAELECEESLILFFPFGKCRVPSVTVVGIKSFNFPTINGPDADVLAAQAASDMVPPRSSPTSRISDGWDDNESWKYNYGKLNYTKLVDGDVVSWYDHTRWVVGETVLSDYWDPNPYNQCSSGIHVFLTREEAENYNF